MRPAENHPFTVILHFPIFNSPLFPFPLADFRHILTVLGDILLMLYQLIAHLLVEVRAAVAKLRQGP